MGITKLTRVSNEGGEMGNPTRHIDREIAIYMEREDMRDSEMAAQLKMTVPTFNAKRRGDRDWKWSALLTMCKLFGITPNQLTGIN